jgi:hypothetical protein
LDAFLRAGYGQHGSGCEYTGDSREALIKWEALDAVFGELDRAINQAGLISRAGQIIAARLSAAPSQRNSDGEKEAIKTHKSAKASQKDTSARWSEEDLEKTWGGVCPTHN